MSNVIIILGIIFSIFLIITIYLANIYIEKEKILELTEIKILFEELINNRNIKIKLLLKNINKHIFCLSNKKALNKLIKSIDKYEIINFSKCWEEFILNLIKNINLSHNIKIKSLMINLGIYLTSYNIELKNNYIKNLVEELDNEIKIKENEFNKKKSINLKYMIVLIILVIVLNM